MINLTRVHNPLKLWEALAEKVLSQKDTKWVDLYLGKRRISYDNRLEIESWPHSFDGEALFWAVGYEVHGSKMQTLFNAYVDPDIFQAFKAEYEEKKTNSHFSIGMQFKRKPSGKGGCLSSFEIVGDRKTLRVFIHSKTAEYPKKFTADLRLISMLLREMQVSPTRVVWHISVIWSADHFVKGIRTILGNTYWSSLLGPKRALELAQYMPGYVEPTQRRIENHYQELAMLEQENGLEMDDTTGRRKSNVPRSPKLSQKSKKSAK